MEAKHIAFSEDGDKAYGKLSDFERISDFIKAVHEQHHQEIIEVENVTIAPCVCTAQGIGAETITPLSETDAVIENYFIADVSEIGIGGAEKE